KLSSSCNMVNTNTSYATRGSGHYASSFPSLTFSTRSTATHRRPDGTVDDLGIVDGRIARAPRIPAVLPRCAADEVQAIRRSLHARSQRRPPCLRPVWRRRFRYSAALMISSATSFGKESIATWLDGTSIAVALAALTWSLSICGGMIASFVATIMKVGFSRHAAWLIGAVRVLMWNGPCVTATRVCSSD